MNYILFALLASFWGGSYIVIKLVVGAGAMPPFFSGALRVGLAIIFLGIIFKFANKKISIPANMRRKVWTIGLFSIGFPFAALFVGERFVTPGITGILGCSIPLWALLLNLPFQKEPAGLPKQKIFGLIIGMLGVFIVFWPSVHFHNGMQQFFGSLAIVAMAMSYATGAILNQRLLANRDAKPIDFYANVFHQNISGFVFLTLLSLFEKWPSFSVLIHSYSLIASFIYLSLFSTAIAWMIYYYLIQEEGVVKAASVAYLVPVATLLWDYIFFHNQPHLFEIYGVVTILAGVMLIQFTKVKPLVKVA